MEASSLSMLLQGSSKIWFQELSQSIFYSPDRGRLTAFLILISLGHLPSENLFLLFVFAQRKQDFYVVPPSFSFFYKDRKKVGEE